ncbi:MAG: glycosyltransferase family 2 protein [Patescibacteria group bacterium]
MPKVFIVIVHYSGLKDTKECLKSLEKLDYSNYEIIVIDNSNNQEFNERVKTIKSKKNIGFAGANNLGLKYAMNNNADYILLLNNDTIVDSKFLKKLVESNYDLCSSKIYYHNSKKVWFESGKINLLYTNAKHVSSKKTQYISGCCMLIKRQVIEKIGLLNEKYFLYFEDVDYCLKARKMGFKSNVVQDSIIWHKVSQSTKKGSFEHIYYNNRNRFLLCKENANFFIKILVYKISFLIFIKQLIKIVFNIDRQYSKIILLALTDFYKSKFGKYD